MPNFIYTTCSKNVNSLCKVSSISCVHSSTISVNSPYSHTIKCVQGQFNELHLLYKSTNIYTYFINNFNLLNKSFTHYPHSLLTNLLYININLIRYTAKR